MNLREYLDLELKSTLIHAIIGAIIGYISFIMNEPKLNLLLALAVLAATSLSLRYLWKIQKNFKWWLSNGVIAFLFIWIIVWTIFYNLKLFA